MLMTHLMVAALAILGGLSLFGEFLQFFLAPDLLLYWKRIKIITASKNLPIGANDKHICIVGIEDDFDQLQRLRISPLQIIEKLASIINNRCNIRIIPE